MATDTQYFGTGRRKESVARVILAPGSGDIIVNGKPYKQYFPLIHQRMLPPQPFATTETEGEYDVDARAHGGGLSGQAGALRHGIARALLEVDEDQFRPLLKEAGFLTRDPRMKERRKYGLKKARKAPQFSKR